MRVKALDPATPWTDYTVTSKASGKTYRVALRGWEPGRMYCSCPDFRKNTLGLCKHTLHVCRKVQAEVPGQGLRDAVEAGPVRRLPDLRPGPRPCASKAPTAGRRKAATVARDLLGRELESPTEFRELLKPCANWNASAKQVTIYPDAEEFLTRMLDREGVIGGMEAIRREPAGAPAARVACSRRRLLPYQLDGIAFAAGAGRAILADDMGLGKTIQGIGVAELLAREAGISPGAGHLPRLAQVPVGGRDRAASRTATASSSSAGTTNGPSSTATARSSPSATTSRCCATRRSSSRSPGT